MDMITAFQYGLTLRKYAELIYLCRLDILTGSLVITRIHFSPGMGIRRVELDIVLPNEGGYDLAIISNLMYILSMRSPVSLAIWIWATGYITKGEEETLDPYVFAELGFPLTTY